MDFILKPFKEGKEKYKGDKTMVLMYNSRQVKMEKYYKMTNKSPTYITALVLDPNLKWKYVESNQKKQQVTKARRMMDNL